MISGNRKSDKLYFYGDGQNTTLNVTTPLFMRGEGSFLKTKKYAVKTLTFNTKNIPRFVPKLWNPEYTNPISGATNNTSLNFNIYPSTGWTTTTNYFVVLRNLNNTTAYMAPITWIPQGKLQNTVYNPSFNDINNDRYTDPFYKLMNFAAFLEMVSGAIDYLISQIPGTYAKTQFNYSPADNLYSLDVDSTILTNYNLEFSDDLNELFLFTTKSIDLCEVTFYNTRYILRTHQIIFPKNIVNINSSSYFEAIGQYSNDIFPFSTIVFHSPSFPFADSSIRTSQDDQNEASQIFKSIFVVEKNELNSFKIEKNHTITNTDISFNLHNVTSGYTDPKINMMMSVIPSDNPNIRIDWKFGQGFAFYMNMNGFDIY